MKYYRLEYHKSYHHARKHHTLWGTATDADDRKLQYIRESLLAAGYIVEVQEIELPVLERVKAQVRGVAA